MHAKEKRLAGLGSRKGPTAVAAWTDRDKCGISRWIHGIHRLSDEQTQKRGLSKGSFTPIMPCLVALVAAT
jgi:hypothetical protein